MAANNASDLYELYRSYGAKHINRAAEIHTYPGATASSITLYHYLSIVSDESSTSKEIKHGLSTNMRARPRCPNLLLG